MEEKDRERRMRTMNTDETTDVPGSGNEDETTDVSLDEKTDIGVIDDRTDVADINGEQTDLGGEQTDVAAGERDYATDYPTQMSGDGYISYIIDGEEYVYSADISAGSSGEANVYLVRKDDKDFALKLYNGTHTPNREILKRIQGLKGSGFFVPIYSYGVCTCRQNNEEYTYELMDYITSPCLSQVDIHHDEELFRKIAVSAAVCIDLCHKKKFIHQDLKPANFFLTDREKGTVMLADFGVSSLMDENGYCYTRQSGTTTYNAPEMYNAAGNKVRLSTKTDFYSLGIMLMSIWMGENKFRMEMGDKAGKDRIFDLNKKKAKGELPYPADLSDNMLLLIKGLTVPDEENRWGFDEVIKWSTGKLVMADMAVAIHDTPFVFNENKGMVAHAPEELAALMNADRDFALRILKRGKVAAWLHECNRNHMATSIDDIVDSEKSDNACVMMAVYTLDKDFAYIGADGKGCKTLKEVGADIGSRKSCDEMITQTGSDFYCFLKAHGRKDLCDKCREIALHNTFNPQWEIAVTLNPDQPFVIYEKNGKTLTLNATAEVTAYFGETKNMPDQQMAYVLTSDAFVKWVSVRDADAADRIGSQMKAGDNADRCWCVLYNLDLNRSYELTLPEESEHCHFSYDDIKEYINDKVIEFFAESSRIRMKEIRQLFLVNEDNSLAANRLYYYLTSKGKDTKELYTFTSSCFKELNVKHSDRCIKMTEGAAIWKAMKGIMGEEKNPRYHLSKSNRDITSTDDLKKVSVSEVRDEIDNSDMAAWIGIFFHDDPFANLSKDYEFERLVNEYVNFIGKIQPSYAPYKKLIQAKGIIDSDINSLKKSYSLFNILRMGLVTVFIFVLAFLIFGMTKWGIGFGSDFAKSNMTGFAITGAVIGALIGIFSLVICESKRGNVKRIIISTVAATIAMVFLNVLAVYALTKMVYILAALLILICALLLARCKKSLLPDTKQYHTLMGITDNGDAMFAQPAHFAFSDIYEKYEYEEQQALNDETRSLKEKAKELVQRLSPGILVYLVLAALLVFITPQLGGKKLTAFDYARLNGVWEGTFEDNAAAIKIESASGDAIKATVFVTFKTSVKESFTGTFNTTDRTFQLNDDTENGILDGQFTGTVNQAMDCYDGQYKSNKSGKLFTFKFTKNKK